MNPLTNVKNITKLNEVELDRGLIGKSSWHDMYKDSAWVFIGGLAYGITEGDVLAVFSQYGEIVNINMVRDKKTGKIKGFCFLCYANQKSTVLAVDNFNGIKLCGRTIRVDHVANYRIPKEHEDTDEVTKALIAEGCAPKAVKLEPPETVPKHTAEKKKEKKKKAKKKKVKSSSSSSSSSETSDSETATSKPPVKKEKYDPGYEKYELESRHAPSQGSSHAVKDTSRKRSRHESSASDDSQEYKQVRYSAKDARHTGAGSTHKDSSKSSYHRQNLSKDRLHEKSDTDSEDRSYRTGKKHSEPSKNSRKLKVLHSERETRHSEYKQGKSRIYEEQHYSHKQHKSDSGVLHRRQNSESGVSSVSSSSDGIKDTKHYSKSKHKHSDIHKRQDTEHSDRRNKYREYENRQHGQEKYKKKHTHHSSSEDDFDKHKHYSSSSQKQKYSSHSKSRG